MSCFLSFSDKALALFISLPMYNLPELTGKTALFASALGERIAIETGHTARIILDQTQDVAELWHRDNCLFSQSCGYPLIHDFNQDLQAIAIPTYTISDCRKGHYQSVYVVNQTSPFRSLADTRGAIAAINGWDSQSGFNCFRHSLLPLDDGSPFYRSVTVSNGHRNSLRLVATAVCDVAAIDQVTYALIQRYQPEELKDIRIIGTSAPAPCLPFVTSVNTSADTKLGLLRALDFVFNQPELTDVLECLLLKSFAPAEPASYLGIRQMAEAGESFPFTKA